jgi:hypothetical protein
VAKELGGRARGKNPQPHSEGQKNSPLARSHPHSHHPSTHTHLQTPNQTTHHRSDGTYTWEQLNLDDVDVRLKFAGLFHRGKRTPKRFMMRLKVRACRV